MPRHRRLDAHLRRRHALPGRLGPRVRAAAVRGGRGALDPAGPPPRQGPQGRRPHGDRLLRRGRLAERADGRDAQRRRQGGPAAAVHLHRQRARDQHVHAGRGEEQRRVPAGPALRRARNQGRRRQPGGRPQDGPRRDGLRPLQRPRHHADPHVPLHGPLAGRPGARARPQDREAVGARRVRPDQALRGDGGGEAHRPRGRQRQGEGRRQEGARLCARLARAAAVARKGARVPRQARHRLQSQGGARRRGGGDGGDGGRRGDGDGAGAPRRAHRQGQEWRDLDRRRRQPRDPRGDDPRPEGRHPRRGPAGDTHPPRFALLLLGGLPPPTRSSL